MKVFDLNELDHDQVSPTYLRKMSFGESLSIAKIEVLQGETTEAHSHESEEAIFVLEGAWLFHLPDEDVIVRSNQVLFIPSGVEHSSEVLENTIALDICSKARTDWQTGLDKELHSNSTQSLWAV
jgi:quercetin dioxygenase-like cupin family protein